MNYEQSEASIALKLFECFSSIINHVNFVVCVCRGAEIANSSLFDVGIDHLFSFQEQRIFRKQDTFDSLIFDFSRGSNTKEPENTNASMRQSKRNIIKHIKRTTARVEELEIAKSLVFVEMALNAGSRQCLAQMFTEPLSVVIKSTSMNLDQQKQAVEVANMALDTCGMENEIATFIKTKFDELTGTLHHRTICNRSITTLLIPHFNVATIQPGCASVIEGVSRSRNAHLDGDTQNYDWDDGYTCHQPNIHPARAAKILFISPSLAKSILLFTGKVADILVEAGHEVIFFIPEVIAENNINGTKLSQRIVRMNNISTAFL
uniref:Uncharacterized protein n=1 Tax=Ditylenchus dipsaci TaxID=166011 RepID=A0A915CLU3_9BILA